MGVSYTSSCCRCDGAFISREIRKNVYELLCEDCILEATVSEMEAVVASEIKRKSKAAEFYRWVDDQLKYDPLSDIKAIYGL